MTMVIAVVVVAIVVGAGCMVVLSNDDNNSDGSVIASQLQIRGNANDDHTIDAEDMKILDDIISGKKTLADYPLADVNGDGTADSKDKQLLQDLIDRKEGTTVYVICLDTEGNSTTVSCEYPIRNAVTYATNVQIPTLYAGAGKYIAGYFNSSYASAENSLNADAVNFGGSTRKITDEEWKKLTELSGNLSSKGEKIGALLVDYSGVSQMTSSRVNDLKAAEIPMLIFSPADSVSEITAVLTIGFLFGKETEKIGQTYAETSWKVIEHINKTLENVSDSEKTTYISCTMYYYICQNDSTFNTSPAVAGGMPYYKVNEEFKNTYAGNSSVKMTSVEALSNYKDIGCIINNRSIDFIMTADEIKNTVLDTWDHSNKGILSSEFFKGFENKICYVNNILPGAVKLAYMAHALYGDKFSDEWADDVMKQFIDMNLEPLKGVTLDNTITHIDYNTYLSYKKD